MVQPLVGVVEIVFSHDFKVQDEHDHHTILVFDRHHIYQAQKTHTWERERESLEDIIISLCETNSCFNSIRKSSHN